MGIIQFSKVNPNYKRRLAFCINIIDEKEATQFRRIDNQLIFFGLGLKENEVFLRWLLIERAKYFSNSPECKMTGWYTAKNGSTSPGKKRFLQQLNIELVELPEYSDIYEKLWQ